MIDGDDEVITRRLNAVVQRLASEQTLLVLHIFRNDASSNRHVLKRSKGRRRPACICEIERKEAIQTLDNMHGYTNRLEDSRQIHGMQLSITSTSSFDIHHTQHDFLKRLDQLSPSILPTLSTLLRRSSLRILNQSSIPTLLKKVQKNNNATSGQGYTTAINAQILLSHASKHCPALYKSHVAELTKAIADERNTRFAEISLQALWSLMKLDSNLVPLDK